MCMKCLAAPDVASFIDIIFAFLFDEFPSTSTFVSSVYEQAIFLFLILLLTDFTLKMSNDAIDSWFSF